MPRPSWNEEYWKKLDEDSRRKIQTTCPHCGSSKTYYNERFKKWRCGSCEHSFVIKGYDGKKLSWWRRIFRFRR